MLLESEQLMQRLDRIARLDCIHQYCNIRKIHVDHGLMYDRTGIRQIDRSQKSKYIFDLYILDHQLQKNSK